MSELVEVQRLRQMLKSSRALLRELAIAVARAEEELERAAHVNAQPEEAQRDQEDERAYCAVA